MAGMADCGLLKSMPISVSRSMPDDHPPIPPSKPKSPTLEPYASNMSWAWLMGGRLATLPTGRPTCCLYWW